MRHRWLALTLLLGACTRDPIAAVDGQPAAQGAADSGPATPPTPPAEASTPPAPLPDASPVQPRADGWSSRPDPDSCQPGQRRWCDGEVYDGWSQVECDPATGRWRTTINDAGQQVLDCRESLAAGKRPNTPCACYHFFFNPACCETPDCLVPAGTSGQTCPPSPGTLCSYCNPLAKECVEPGALCVVTSSHESFCGRSCGLSAPCPAGYDCMTVKLGGNQTTQQCIPTDFSCYS